MSEFFLYTLVLAHNVSGQEPPIEECHELSLALPVQQTNITCVDHAPSLTNLLLWKAIFLLMLAVVTIVSNGWMMVSILRKQKQRSSRLYTLVFHLAVADIFVAVYCMFGEAFGSFTVEWVLGNVGCKILKFSQMFSLYLSTFVVVLIAIDHCISITHPLKLLSRGKCIRLVGFCWIASAGLSCPQVIFFHVEEGPFRESFIQCVTQNFYTAVWQEQMYVALSSIFMFAIPLIILVCTQIRTFWMLHREEKFGCSLVSDSWVNPRRRKIMRGAKMKSLQNSLTITLTFVACRTPYYVLMALQASNELKPYVFIFGMITSLFNPLIYGQLHVYHRQKREHLGRGILSKKPSVTMMIKPRVRTVAVRH